MTNPANHKHRQPTEIHFTLPDWLPSYIGDIDAIPGMDERMAFVLGAARLNTRYKTGGPFAAAVFESRSGRLVSLGVNLVTTQGLSILHAEMVAITLAQRKLGVYDLGNADQPQHQLVTSTEPCAMCFGAIPWSGIRELVAGARDEDARAIGFDEGPKLTEWQSALAGRGIKVVTDLKRTDAIAVLEDYRARDGHIYNSREGD
jgi:tRNA(Arg) A34 adenosine deaminase TadA